MPPALLLPEREKAVIDWELHNILSTEKKKQSRILIELNLWLDLFYSNVNFAHL